MPQNSTVPRPLKEKSISTEAKIKEAAHKVFLAKGFTATTVRDVAKEAGTNVALVNYYFRSKGNLFNVIMMEKVQQIFGTLIPIVNDETTSLHQKIDQVVNCYINFLSINPELPTFIINEIRKKNFEFLSEVRADKILLQSQFIKQLKSTNADVNPVQFLISLLGMVIFPFIAKPILVQAGLVNDKAFHKMMDERRKLVPAWAKSMLNVNV